MIYLVIVFPKRWFSSIWSISVGKVPNKLDHYVQLFSPYGNRSQVVISAREDKWLARNYLRSPKTGGIRDPLLLTKVKTFMISGSPWWKSATKDSTWIWKGLILKSSKMPSYWLDTHRFPGENWNEISVCGALQFEVSQVDQAINISCADWVTTNRSIDGAEEKKNIHYYFPGYGTPL
jgi:hypothetical protein